MTLISIASARRVTPAITCTICVAALLFLLTMRGIAQETKSSVVQVSVLFRHGERAPRAFFAHEPHQKSDWPEGLEQLTMQGKTHLFQLGQELHHRYRQLLNDDLRENSLHVRSSSSTRSIMGAAVLLAGLVPPEVQKRLNPGLDWKPIPVHYLPEDKDHMLQMKKPCPLYDRELQKVFNSSETKGLQREYSDLYKFLSNNTGEQIIDFHGAQKIYDILICKKWNNQTMPSWASSIFPGKLDYLVAKLRGLYTHNDVMKRIKSGPLLGDITTHMENLAENPLTSTPKMYLYSGHGEHLHNMMRSLGFNELVEIDFGSSILFELHSDTAKRKFFVKVLFYNMMVLSEPISLDVPGCGTSCDLDTFVKIVQPLILKDWEEECGAEVVETK